MDDLAAETPERGQFSTTHWSVVVSSGAENSQADGALAQLCGVYWRPIFSFLIRRGYSLSDAQDLTQEFFMRLLDGKLISTAHPSRGRFRSLLLKALQNFLLDAYDKRSAKRRGGEIRFVSWDDWMAEAPSHAALPAQAMESWPAERIFDVRWAATIVEQALRSLREECEARGRGRVFDALKGALTTERNEVSYARLGAQLGIAEVVVKRLLHGMRERYRTLLRQEVARTVDTEEELEDEVRYLCAILARNEPVSS